MGKRVRNKDIHEEREAQKYEHPIPSREFILQHLVERGSPASLKTLIVELHLKEPFEQEALRRRLRAMERDGQLHKNRRGAYGALGKMELITGTVIGHRDGYGFLTPSEGGDDLFLNARQMRGVMHRDKVLARVSGVDHRGRQEAAIIEVLEANTKELVGRFINESGAAYVQPSNQRLTHDILIPPDAVGQAKNGQMVVVEIVSQPTTSSRPIGKVSEILGDHMAPGMEIDVAIRNHDLPNVWPEEVLAEAAEFTSLVSPESIVGRMDLRHLPFVTIDGEDAKDFDDAVYCEPKSKGGWLLYVAIADVSYYVKPNTALDTEALNRGNSVYFPGNVIPMLPEILSNGLCSLNPHVDRLAMVCEMAISATGKITRYQFYEAVFKSQARLTYNEVYAMSVLEEAALQARFQNLLPHINNLFLIYHILHKARKERGAIDFDLPETKIIFGEGRKIERVIPLIRNDAHRLIEECMLCANICAALFLSKNEQPTLYRVHEGPSLEKLDDLRRFLGEMGLKLPGRKIPAPRDYAKLLSMIAERPDAHVIQTVLLRSLSQAIYSVDNKGHFGLAFDAYTHFTSPIRRYPDLLVHRAIKHVLQHDNKVENSLPKMEKFGVHCSMTERRADDATREAVDWLKCEYMLDKVGDIFPGVISSVTSFGFFVELSEIYVEGLVHISHLPNDYYQFDPTKMALIGERTGKRFRLGDLVTVQVARVDLDERKIDFVLPNGSLEKQTKKKKTRKNLL